MEKEEKLREWCLDRALQLLISDHSVGVIDVQKVTETSRKLEDYIVG